MHKKVNTFYIKSKLNQYSKSFILVAMKTSITVTSFLQ